MGIARPAHVSAKRDGKDRTVAQWIKMHYNVCPIALDTVHSIWTHRHAIAKRNGAVTIVQKVHGKTREICIHIKQKQWQSAEKTIIIPHHFDNANDEDDDD